MTKFEISLIKGEIGESIIRKYLEKKGWVVYFPFTKDKAHYFDMLCTLDKDMVIAIDVKTKARLNKWKAQGINIKSYKEYLDFVMKSKVSFYLIFIDDKTGDVHGVDITKLKDPIYPRPDIIAWKLEQMNFMFKITEDEILQLTKYDQRKHDFNPTEL